MGRRGFFLGVLVVMAAIRVGIPAAQSILPDGRRANGPLHATADELAERTGVLLVDIREPDEWRQTGVLTQARLHSWRTPEEFSQAFGAEISGGRNIVLICRSGNRSGKAAKTLSWFLGRTVEDVAGGMNRLLAEGAATVRPTPAMGCATC